MSDSAKQTKKKHKHPQRSCYDAMIARCYTSTNHAYCYFGARGIRVCDRWARGQKGGIGFRNFVQDMGPKPEGTMLTRRDPDLDFSPENCFWGGWSDQVAVRRPRGSSGICARQLDSNARNEIIALRNQGYKLAEIAAKFNISIGYCCKLANSRRDFLIEATSV